jgi:hypothetical protein
MQITREYVEATLANVRQQEAEARTLAERAHGAVLLCEALLARLDEAKPEAPSPDGGSANG